MTHRMARAIQGIAAHRRTALVVGAMLLLAGAPFAVQLYSNLRSQIEEVLPSSAPSVIALRELHERLGDNVQLAVYVTGGTPDRRHAFLDRFAEESRSLPLAPRFVDYRINEVREFFEARKALFIEMADLEALEQRVDARVAYEKKKVDPLKLGLDDDDDVPPPLNLDAITEKYQDRARELTTYPSGFYDSDDGRASVIYFYPQANATDYANSVRFRDDLDALGHRIAVQMGNADIHFQFTGDVEQLIREQRSLQADLLLSTILVLLFETLLVLRFYRWWPSVVALGFPLAVGTSITFAIGWFAIGSLNASSAFLGSIIVGNGVNPGIILLSRFVEERRRGLAPRPAMRTAVQGTLSATIVASAAAAVAYGALMMTSFRGFSQFGLLGGIGMVLCWLANYALLPPLALALEERFPLRYTTRPSAMARFFSWLGQFVVRRPRPILAVTAVLALAGALSIARVARDPVENDTTKLRSRWATEPGGYGEVSDKIDGIVKRVMTPVVVLVKNETDVPALEDRYRQVIEKGASDQLLGRAFSIFTLVPRDQEKKLEILARIRSQLSPTRLARLDEKTRELVRRWLPPPDLRPFGVKDLPEYIRRQVREKDGSEGKLLLLYPKHGTETQDGRVLRRLANEVRAVPLPEGAQVAGSYLIFADMISSIFADGPMAVLVALFGVMVLSLALARGARGSLVVTGSLLLGVILTCGVAAAVGLRLNFLNFIALPITFGIGVDYAANVYGRYALGRPGQGSLEKTIAQSGAAVAVCSATTVIGYSSLLFSRNGALFSFGLLACIGEIACLASALLFLPAVVALRRGASSARAQELGLGAVLGGGDEIVL